MVYNYDFERFQMSFNVDFEHISQKSLAFYFIICISSYNYNSYFLKMKNSDKVFGEFNLCMNFYLQHKNLYFESLLFALNTRIRELILPRIRFILSKVDIFVCRNFRIFGKFPSFLVLLKAEKGKSRLGRREIFGILSDFLKFCFVS